VRADSGGDDAEDRRPGSALDAAARPARGRPVTAPAAPVFEHILVAVDLSERSELAVHRSAELAAPGATSVTLLHVIESIHGVAEQELAGFYAKLREGAERKLGEWSSRLAGRGLAVRHEIVLGRPGPEVVRYAEAQGVDLIVLGSHVIEPDRPGHGLGTLSHQVALVAPCSVLLVR
jgi:nucleotide-binding universal stress UspA family protein